MQTTNRQRKQPRVCLVFYLLATHSLRQRGAETLRRPGVSSVSPQANHHTGAHHKSAAPAPLELNLPLAPSQIIKTRSVTLNC